MGKNVNKNIKYWAGAGIIISWATFWLFLLSPFGLLIWLGIFIYLIAKRSYLKWYLIFSAWIFVPGCSFMMGVGNYYAGSAILQGIGGPQTYHGIDRETRVAATSSGCIFIGFEPFVFPANNTAIKLCTNLFGYQHGAYSGIFPTEEEALELMKTADTIAVKKVEKAYKFEIPNQPMQIDTSWFYWYYSSKPFNRVKGKVVNKQCFLFQKFDNENGEYQAIYLVDIKNNKLLTQYFGYY